MKWFSEPWTVQWRKGYNEKALIFGQEHAHVASSYNNLGIDYLLLGQYNEAKEHHEKALVINKKIFCAEHAHVALSYNNLGNDYQHLGQYNEAKEYHEKALVINEKIFGEEHANVTSSYNKLGKWLLAPSTVLWSKRILWEGTVNQENNFGAGHADVAASYHSLRIFWHVFKQCSKGDEWDKNARGTLKLCNQTSKTHSTSLTSSKLSRLENCWQIPQIV